MRKSPGAGHGNPLQYSCLENPHGQRSLAGYSPWGAELDMTERLGMHAPTYVHTVGYIDLSIYIQLLIIYKYCTQTEIEDVCVPPSPLCLPQFASPHAPERATILVVPVL